ncbi:nuclear transport factor 2 family protein [Streptomyces sp. NPDC058011]|uniref:nuclear transport factor 2 family protein n=1 Tax=Streptomyces sp. NPDC058011 TaxID=3346305 RepID=UPI0036F11C29
MTAVPQASSPDPADELALRKLSERYALALDSRDREAFTGVFTADGVLVAYGRDGKETLRRTGPAELVGEIDDLAAFDGLFHPVTAHVAVVAAGGGTAAGTALCGAHHYTEADGTATDLYCPVRYEDTYVRTSEGWRIARREVHVLWMDLRTVTAPGG